MGLPMRSGESSSEARKPMRRVSSARPARCRGPVMPSGFWSSSHDVGTRDAGRGTRDDAVSSPESRVPSPARYTSRPMDFDLTDEQELLRTAVREFAQEAVRPRAATIDQTGEFPRDLFSEAGKL